MRDDKEAEQIAKDRLMDKDPIPLLSNGIPSTLGNWYKMCVTFFGEDSKGTIFIKDKLDKQGPDEPVLSHEGQLLMAIHNMDLQGRYEQELIEEAVQITKDN